MQDATEKKRRFSPSHMMADENSLKRQKIDSARKFPWVVDTMELLLENQRLKQENQRIELESCLKLENQRLKLESRHAIELFKKESNSQRFVIELLQKNITKLEHQVDTNRPQLEKHEGLEISNIERRLKFPWLSVYHSKVTPSGKGEISWEELPTNIVFFILEFLTDDNLFVLRGLSTQFYEAFYCQKKVLIDCERAIWLAKRGRKFTNLVGFVPGGLDGSTDDMTFTRHDFRALNEFTFPKLAVVWLTNYTDFSYMKSHPNLRELRMTLECEEDLKYVSDSNFPLLEVLIVDGFGECILYLPGHKRLTHIVFDNCRPDLDDIMELKESKFPQLRTVGIIGKLPAPGVLDYLQQQSINFSANLQKLSLVAREYGMFAY